MTRPANILLVEDQRIDIELTLAAFRQARLGNTVRIATSGEEALDYLYREGKYEDRKEYPLPDLILLDLNMPGINGFEVLKRIRNTPEVNRIPVIILTASKEEGDRTLAYDLGTNNYLVKPVTSESLLRTINHTEQFWIVLNVRDAI